MGVKVGVWIYRCGLGRSCWGSPGRGSALAYGEIRDIITLIIKEPRSGRRRVEGRCGGCQMGGKRCGDDGSLSDYVKYIRYERSTVLIDSCA